MSRLPQRSSAIQSKVEPENGASPSRSLPAEPVKIGLGWRLAVLLWMGGFAAIFAFELWNLLWQLGKRLF